MKLFNKRLAAALGLSMVLALVVAACGGSDPTAAPAAPAATKAPAATAVPQPTEAPAPSKHGGTLVIPLLADAGSLDPAFSGYFFNYGLGANVYNPLIRYNWEDPRSKPVPGLAVSWEASSDVTSYTFKFREGTKWHDGTPFKSSDAAFSLAGNQGRFAPQLEKVSSYDTPDDLTLVINLSEASASLPGLLAHMRFPIWAEHVSNGVGGDLSEGPSIGTGAFKLASFDRNVEYVLEKNSDFFLEGLPYLDSIKAVVVGEEATRLAQFRAGALHVLGPSATMVDGETLADLKGTVKDAKELSFSALDIMVVVINAAKAPLDDVNMRRAVFLALNRVEMAEGLPFISKPAGPLVGPPGWGLSDEELAATPGYRSGADYDADLAEAKKLVEAAGGLTVEIIGSPTAALITTLEVVVDHLGRAGITVAASSGPVESAEDVARRTEGDFELNMQSVGLAFPDPDGAFIAVQPGLFTKLEDAQITQLFADQAVEGDAAKRGDLVKQMQQRMIDQVSMVPIGWQQNFWVAQANVNGLWPPLGWTDANWDHVWLTQ